MRECIKKIYKVNAISFGKISFPGKEDAFSKDFLNSLVPKVTPQHNITLNRRTCVVLCFTRIVSCCLVLLIVKFSRVHRKPLESCLWVNLANKIFIKILFQKLYQILILEMHFKINVLKRFLWKHFLEFSWHMQQMK